MSFPFLDGGVPCSTSYGVCVSRLVRFARVSGRVGVFLVLVVGFRQRGFSGRGVGVVQFV